MAETVSATTILSASFTLVGTNPEEVLTSTNHLPAGGRVVSVQESCVAVPVATHMLPPMEIMASLVGRSVPVAIADLPTKAWPVISSVPGFTRLKSQLFAGQRALMPAIFIVSYGSSLTVLSISRGTAS